MARPGKNVLALLCEEIGEEIGEELDHGLAARRYAITSVGRALHGAVLRAVRPF
ncbi:hypothetical protein [Streptomyces sp. NPDC006510]|uniref:hypothetical protein n=1 Tax=Streptomyces sp. NPDC006510 TaxID=3155600 RepID=UPI0033B5E221